MLALTFVLFFIFIFDSRAVGDFRAEFCNKPIARTPRPFDLILRLLIRRAVYCNLFLKRRKRSKSHEAMGVQSLGPRRETLFCFSVSVPIGSCPIQYRPSQE
jgi:hypothetical protein